MNDNRLYFEITGDLIRLVKKHARRVASIRKARTQFLKRFGATRWYGSESYISAIPWPLANGDPPPGWRRVSGSLRRRYIRPALRTPEGKEHAKVLSALTLPDPTELFEACGIRNIYGAGAHSILRSHVGRIGQRYFLIVGQDTKSQLIKHKHLKPMKRWQFFKVEDELGDLLWVA
ncbi:MAG: hypothetical protein H6818_06840 [Phycisphaerales bacterium]|nr:hypothetical protein [Phycisphaerales bacterium]MCB9864873.1 hypothetical protein [Phycisphaerales bacterium]